MTSDYYSRRDFVKAMGLTTAAVAFGMGENLADAARKKKQPNIVFILTDDHASHAMSCYGSKINKTPNLDRIANEGMRFDNAFCTNSICVPSRATIMTGQYSHTNGVRTQAGANIGIGKLLDHRQAGQQPIGRTTTCTGSDRRAGS